MLGSFVSVVFCFVLFLFFFNFVFFLGEIGSDQMKKPCQPQKLLSSFILFHYRKVRDQTLLCFFPVKQEACEFLCTKLKQFHPHKGI